MPLPPVRYATLAIVVFLAIAGFDIVTGLEHWPFGSYPMYSLSYPEELSWLRLYAVTDRGQIALRGERDFIVTGLEHWPFGSYPMYSLSYPEELSWLRLYA